jgi:hypothetical protein
MRHWRSWWRWKWESVSVKERDRGVWDGEFVPAMAAVRLPGEDHLIGFGHLRANSVAKRLLPVPIPASITAATLATRFGKTRCEGVARACAGIAAKILRTLPTTERVWSLADLVTTDLDVKDLEVFFVRKEQVARSPGGRSTHANYPICGVL